MARYFIAGNYHRAALSPEWRASADDIDGFAFPPNIVLGFRAIFWQAFTGVYHCETSATAQMQLGGQTWRLRSLVLLESADAVDRLGLADDTVLVLAAEIEARDVPATYNLNRALFEAGVTEQAFVNQIIEGLGDEPGLSWLKTLEHDRDLPGRYILKHKRVYGGGLAPLALFGFYFLGLLIFWQISRDQVSIGLSDDVFDAEANGRDLLLLRKRIINLDRLFLTSSVSNHPGMRTLARDCLAQQRLRTRFLRLPELNDRIEKYFEIVSQLSVRTQQRNLNVIALVIAILGLPMSLMSMMLALSTKAEVLTTPFSLLGASKVQLFFAASFGASITLLIGLAALTGFRYRAALRRMIKAMTRGRPAPVRGRRR